MTTNETTPNPVARVGVADVFSSAALDSRKDSAFIRARQVRTSAEFISSSDSSALHAVLAAPTLAAAQAVAQAEIDRLGAPSLSDVLEVDEAAEIAGRTPSTVRRWAAAHHLGRRLGGRWILSRHRFAAFIEGNA